MIGRLLLLCALVVLAIASLRTEPLQVSVAQQITSTPTATRTPTASPSLTATASPTASRTPTATATATSTVTPTATATSTRTVGPTATATASRTPSRTTTPTVTLTPTTTRTATATMTVAPTSTGTPTRTPTVVPPVITDLNVSSITRSGATLSWTTNLPTTSQVDYGVAADDAQHSALDPSLVTSHRVVLTGLLPGTTYRYRVRSAPGGATTVATGVNAVTGGTTPGDGAAADNATTAAGAAVAISAEATLLTAPAGSGPDITSLAVRLVTGSTAIVDWTTTTGTVAQVEYGPTANYGAFTLLNVYREPTQEMSLTGLRPSTLYHFRIKGWDGDGFLSASADSTFVTAPDGPATLIGDQVVQPERFALPAGQAMAYQFAASQSGQASLMRVFVDAGGGTPVLRVALYSDEDGAVGSILSQGSAPALLPGWIAVSIPPVQLVQGTRYWVAVLSPVGTGSLNLRQALTGGSSLSSAQTTLAAFPQVWTPGASGAKSPLAVSIDQVPPAITLTGPADGSIITGQADLSAVVDDDLPLARFQFLVDGVPAGPPLFSPPYVFTWDSSKVNAAAPHTISATATDFAGRTSTSAQVSVQVDHGPLITGVSMTAGLTATSARISWTTDVLADGAVEYGLSSAYGASTPLDARPDWRHEMQLTGLAPGAAYHYRVRSRDAYGALAVSPDQVFFTPPAP